MSRLSWLVLSAAFSVVQAQTPNTVVEGPYGVPQLVRTEGGSWSRPIQILSNAQEIVYVPDITSSDWVSWHLEAFNSKGEYFTYVYTYLKKVHTTVQDTLYVNVNTNHATVVRFLKPSIQIDLRNTTASILQTTTNITKLVRSSVLHYHGPTLSEEQRDQKRLALHNLGVMQQRESEAH